MIITAAVELRKLITEAKETATNAKALHFLLEAERALDSFDYDGAGMRYAQAMNVQDNPSGCIKGL